MNILPRDDNGNAYNRVWKSKVPEKIKMFTWLVEQKYILTKDNMVKRKWKGNPGWFCTCPQTTDHLLLECPTAKVWGGEGVITICFNKKVRSGSYEQF
jgi:hypothetical protein